MKKFYDENKISISGKMTLAFALGKAFDDIKDFFTGQPEGQSDFEEALRDKWSDIQSKRPPEIRSDPMLEIAEAGLLNDIEYKTHEEAKSSLDHFQENVFYKFLEIFLYKAIIVAVAAAIPTTNSA